MDSGKGDNWVYKSQHPFTLVIKPTTRRNARDQYGNETVLVEKAKKVVFRNCFLVVNDGLSHELDLPKETIVEWVEAQPPFGKRFWLVSSPDKKVSKEVAGEIEEAGKSDSKVKVIHGPRKTGRATK